MNWTWKERLLAPEFWFFATLMLAMAGNFVIFFGWLFKSIWLLRIGAALTAPLLMLVGLGVLIAVPVLIVARIRQK